MTREDGEITITTSAFEVNIGVSDDYRTLFFPSGKDLWDFRDSFSNRLLLLWSSSLARPLNDTLVVQDSAKYPYEENAGIYLIQDKLDPDNLIAFYNFHQTEVLGYTGLTVLICLVDQKYQSRGIMKKLIADSIHRVKPDFLYFSTQSEHMVRTIRPFCPEGSLFPFDGEIPENFCGIALELNKTRLETYDPKLMIRRKLYGQGNPLYGDRKEKIGKDDQIHNFFQNNVNFQEGDAIFVVGLNPKGRSILKNFMYLAL